MKFLFTVFLLFIIVIQEVYSIRFPDAKETDLDRIQSDYSYRQPIDFFSPNLIIDSGACAFRPSPPDNDNPNFEHDLNRFLNGLSTFEYLPPDNPRSPKDLLVDVINNVGLNLLELHNVDNYNNIAISPYGVVSVLVALLEGLSGEAAYEIRNALNLPSDIRLIRVGLRDIHRHLKTYFIPPEGILAGLTMSHDNISFTREYRAILKFYGYDIEAFSYTFNTSSISTERTTESLKTTLNGREGQDPPYLEATTLPLPGEERSITTEGTTEGTTLITNNEGTVVDESITDEQPTTRTTTFTSIEPSTTLDSSTTSSGIATTSESNLETISTSAQENNNDVGNEVTDTQTQVNMETTTDTEESSAEEDTNTKVTPQLRRRRSMVDYLIARYYDDYYTTSDHRRYNLPTDAYDPYSMMMMKAEHRDTNVNLMTYDTILPYHYIRSLDAMALSFPLDSNMYYLLLVLPAHDQNIDKLICNMRMTIELRSIVGQLGHTHVKAIVPSFFLRGNVVLTETLQKLGIRDIFEPHHADFSPMTLERNLYVTNIEQAVTIRIRNYMDLHQSTDGNYNHYRPVEVRADGPFLYFVMDSQIHVSLMAGKILNPLSSHIG